MYPSWRYHRTEEPKLIHSASEEAEGWEDSPAKFEVPLHECKPGESYKEHMEAFDAKDEGEVKKPRRKAKS